MYDNRQVIAPEVEQRSAHVENHQRVCAKPRGGGFHRHYMQILADFQTLAPISVHSIQ